jgi:ribosome biogenesis GTPase
MSEGTVFVVQGGRYQVSLDDGGLVEASLRGRLKTLARTGDRVVIGDRVRVAGEGDGGLTIDEVLPRVAELVRRGPGGRRPKILAANLDHLVVVTSAVSPDVTPELVDRILVVGEAGEIPTTLVVNKLDLPGGVDRATPIAELYGRIGYPVILTSAITGQGLDQLREVICTGSSALIGPSGVGKSTLLNALEPGLNLRVGELSPKIRRGRHTTVTSRMLPLACGGTVADTPGFGDVGLWGVEQRDLDRFFPEFQPFVLQCRFRGCSHVQEPGCAVQAAVEAGEIAESRYRSYRTLREEAA